MRHALYAAAVLCSLAPSALAQQDVTPALKRYIDSEARRIEISRTVRKMVPVVASTCTDIKAGDKTKTEVLTPIAFNTEGKPISGLMREIVPIAICGETIPFNIFAKPQPNGEVLRMNGLPGKTRATLVLQHDTLKGVFPVAMSQAKCNDPKTLGIRNTTQVSRDAASGAWTEEWIVTACAKAVPIKIEFQPDADGTRYLIKDDRRPAQ